MRVCHFSQLDGEVVHGPNDSVVVCGRWRHYVVEEGPYSSVCGWCHSHGGCWCSTGSPYRQNMGTASKIETPDRKGTRLGGAGTLDSEATGATGKSRCFPRGTFEMTFSASDGTATGWWLPDSHSDAHRRPWRWKELWLDAAVHGVAMSQFGMVAAWIFVLQTGCSLGLAVADASDAGAGRAATGLNLGFNAMYTLLYAGFLLAYSRMRRQSKPAPTYHAGVALYTVGYAAFFALYAVSYAELTIDTTTAAKGLYVAGSCLFLVGSVLLVSATAPVGRGCRRRWCGAAPADSLFWGSVLFLVGSGCFLLDSIWEGASARASCVVAGNTAFLSGRLFFVHGGCTNQCDALLRDRSSRNPRLQEDIERHTGV